MEVPVVGPPVGEPVDQPRITVVGEDHWLVRGEQRVEVGVRQPVRAFGLVLHPKEVYDVDHPDGQIREVGAQKVHGGEGLHGGNVPGTTKHHIRFRVRVCAGPVPDADALGAVNDGVVHV